MIQHTLGNAPKSETTPAFAFETQQSSAATLSGLNGRHHCAPRVARSSQPLGWRSQSLRDWKCVLRALLQFRQGLFYLREIRQVFGSRGLLAVLDDAVLVDDESST